MKATRELFGFGVLPFLIAGMVYLPAWILLIVLGIALVGAGHELLSMARCEERPCGQFVPLLLLAIVMAASWTFGLIGLAGSTALALIVLPGIQMTHPNTPRGGLNAVAVASFTVLYVGITGASMGWIRLLFEGPHGYHMLMIFLAGIWGGDTGAYYTGKTFGRHKMSPRVSPKKTWEGLGGGIVGSLFFAAVMKIILGNPTPWVHLVCLAGAVMVGGSAHDDLHGPGVDPQRLRVRPLRQLRPGFVPRQCHVITPRSAASRWPGSPRPRSRGSHSPARSTRSHGSTTTRSARRGRPRRTRGR